MLLIFISSGTFSFCCFFDLYVSSRAGSVQPGMNEPKDKEQWQNVFVKAMLWSGMVAYTFSPNT